MNESGAARLPWRCKVKTCKGGVVAAQPLQSWPPPIPCHLLRRARRVIRKTLSAGRVRQRRLATRSQKPPSQGGNGWVRSRVVGANVSSAIRFWRHIAIPATGSAPHRRK